MQDLLYFRRMISPILIQVIYWVGVGLVVLAGLIGVVAGLIQFSLGAIVGSLIMLVIGPLVVRVYCELLIIAFRVYDTLVEIRDALGGPKV